MGTSANGGLRAGGRIGKAKRSARRDLGRRQGEQMANGNMHLGPAMRAFGQRVRAAEVVDSISDVFRHGGSFGVGGLGGIGRLVDQRADGFMDADA